MSIVSDMINEIAHLAARKLNRAVDDALAGLLAAGVPRDEIEIKSFPDKTRIAVRGVDRYEFRVSFSVKNALFVKSD